MPTIESKIKNDSKEFAANDAVNRQLAADLRQVREKISAGGNKRSRERHLARGKLLPRDRIRSVVDRGAPFLEIGQLAAYGLYDDEVPAAGIVTGIGAATSTRAVYPIASRERTRARPRVELVGRPTDPEEACAPSSSIAG